MDTRSIRPTFTEVPASSRPTGLERLVRLEARYRHELMTDDERQELRDRVLTLRRRLGL